MVDSIIAQMNLQQLEKQVHTFQAVKMGIFGGRKFCLTGSDNKIHKFALKDILKHIDQLAQKKMHGKYLTYADKESIQVLIPALDKLDSGYAVTVASHGLLRYILTCLRRLSNIGFDKYKLLYLLEKNSKGIESLDSVLDLALQGKSEKPASNEVIPPSQSEKPASNEVIPTSQSEKLAPSQSKKPALNSNKSALSDVILNSQQDLIQSKKLKAKGINIKMMNNTTMTFNLSENTLADLPSGNYFLYSCSTPRYKEKIPKKDVLEMFQASHDHPVCILILKWIAITKETLKDYGGTMSSTLATFACPESGDLDPSMDKEIIEKIKEKKCYLWHLFYPSDTPSPEELQVYTKENQKIVDQIKENLS